MKITLNNISEIILNDKKLKHKLKQFLPLELEELDNAIIRGLPQAIKTKIALGILTMLEDPEILRTLQVHFQEPVLIQVTDPNFVHHAMFSLDKVTNMQQFCKNFAIYRNKENLFLTCFSQ